MILAADSVVDVRSLRSSMRRASAAGLGRLASSINSFAELLVERSTGPSSAGGKLVSGAVGYVSHGDRCHACARAAHAVIRQHAPRVTHSDSLPPRPSTSTTPERCEVLVGTVTSTTCERAGPHDRDRHVGMDRVPPRHRVSGLRRGGSTPRRRRRGLRSDPDGNPGRSKRRGPPPSASGSPCSGDCPSDRTGRP